MHESRRILELAAFGQQRLIEQQARQLAERELEIGRQIQSGFLVARGEGRRELLA